MLDEVSEKGKKENKEKKEKKKRKSNAVGSREVPARPISGITKKPREIVCRKEGPPSKGLARKSVA